MNESKIAQTIQNQLKQTLGMNVIFSCGQSALQVVSIKSTLDLGIENSIGALKFRVNGHHHKGHVVVSLNGVDTYDVFVCSVRSGKMKVKKQALGLYVDEFGSLVDNQVEKIEDYSF